MSHVLVTGANRGLGLEFARQFLARGDHVVATCRDVAAASELRQLAAGHEGRLVVLPLELPGAESIRAFAAEFALLELRIDLLVNNAGVLNPGERFGSITLDELDAAFAANAAGPFLLTQALAPHLVDGARVVNLSSRLGSIAGSDGFHTPSYAISKAALNMAGRLLSHALAERGIPVVAISPGWVRTAMGGTNATLAPEESVAAMLRVIDRLDMQASGRFLGTDGQPIPW
ncbi:MAG: SDR family oxidoreductase [Xanthomonadales bacterium]|nr:SDR family oxidoreductase [Xanthomonadales bacterium]